jgi:6-phospho-beta-glucosidase
MPALKIAVIGGGSTYTPELVSGFLDRQESIPLAELRLMDVDAERLEVVGRFVQRMAAARGAPFEVTLTTERRAALAGAHYVLTQLRVGGMEARREDEYLGRRYGLVGQETTGVGGMAKALRTLPVILDVAAEMQEVAPDALLVNFANPSGLITEGLSRYAPEIAAVGLCNAPFHTKMVILEALQERSGVELPPEKVELDVLGLNHLSWYRGLSVEGRDLWSEVLTAYIDQLRSQPQPDWSPATIEALGMIPNYYLKYYYQTARQVAQQETWPPSRAEEVMAIEGDLLDQYAEPERVEPPETLMERGGAYYSTVAAQLISAHHNDLGEVHVVNVPHGGAVRGWPTGWVLELPCRVGRGGVEPLPAEPLPPVAFGLLAHVKAYELLTVEAAVHGDRRAAHQALLVHPLGPPAGEVEQVLDDLLESHRRYLPRFWA